MTPAYAGQLWSSSSISTFSCIDVVKMVVAYRKLVLGGNEAMGSVKESLYKAIELLSDEEARQLLEFAQRLQKKSGISLTLRRLASDPAFRIPSEGSGAFHVVEPVQGKGIAASRLLVEDRR